MSKLIYLICFALTLFLVGCGVPRPQEATSTPSESASLPTATSAPTGDPVRGQDIFSHGVNDSPPCASCHHTMSGQTGFAIAPNLESISTRAGTQVEGLTAEEYIHQSILEPHAFVVGGYRDIMYPTYSDHFNEQDLLDLIAYLLTL